MHIFGTAEKVRSTPWQAWGLAIAAFGTALAIRFAFDEVLPAGFPYLTFFPAVILTTFFAGSVPGTACAVVCGLAAWYWFIAPFESFEFNASVVVALGFYAFVVCVDILLIHVMHKAVDELKMERRLTGSLVHEQERLLSEQRDHQRHQRVLQRELSHRMKNTLAMVQAVVSQSLRNASDPRVAADLASARIQALARAQDALTATDWSAADVETIVQTAIAPHRDGDERVRMSGPRVELDAQRALGLALAIHELATNATKYGALSNETGVVTILWDVVDDRFSFRWKETGGPLVHQPSRQGFGSRLTNRVVPSYFGGSGGTEYAPDGIDYALDGPVGEDQPDHARS